MDQEVASLSRMTELFPATEP